MKELLNLNMEIKIENLIMQLVMMKLLRFNTYIHVHLLQLENFVSFMENIAIHVFIK